MADLKVLYSVCDKLSEELANANRRIEKIDKLTMSDIEYLDKLTHAIKSIKTTIAMAEANEGHSNYYPYSYGDHEYSYARKGTRRDEMGRYSRDTESIKHQMRELMNATNDDRTRREIQRILDDM